MACATLAFFRRGCHAFEDYDVFGDLKCKSQLISRRFNLLVLPWHSLYFRFHCSITDTFFFNNIQQF